MRTPQRYLTGKYDIYQVIGLTFKPQITSISQTQENVKIPFKVADLDHPINFIPYFQNNERAHVN